MNLKCFTRQKNNGAKYTTCNKDAQPKAKSKPRSKAKASNFFRRNAGSQKTALNSDTS